jgi:transposase-like protein
MPVCRNCYSRDLIKFGKYNNLQKWHCENCGLTSVYVMQRKLKTKIVNKPSPHIEMNDKE